MVFSNRHARAITLVSGAAVLARLAFEGKEVSLGILIGGLLPIIYFDIMRQDLAKSVSSPATGVRGRLFLDFLVRYGMLALGLGLAMWISNRAFWAAVAAMGVMYAGQLAVFSLEWRYASPISAVSEPENHEESALGASDGNDR
jgi:hypothetical protein